MPRFRRRYRTIDPGRLAFVVAVGLVSLVAANARAARPVVAGFERFYRGEGADRSRGGRLLLGELNCAACHTADKAVQATMRQKEAPILDDVGTRARPAWLRKFIANPHAVKPGTTMPELFVGMSSDSKKEQVEALVHFLATTGTAAEVPPDRKMLNNGRKLFGQVGCLACHAPVEGEEAAPANSVPLPQLAEKYTIPGLIGFLKDPLRVRPSGRMPAQVLNDNEVRDVSHYLLRDRSVAPNLHFRYYEGSWEKLPDFDQLEPVAAGKSAGFDVGVARRGDRFALRFDGYFDVARAGDYKFHLTSDDGSRLDIDGRTVVDHDGVHSHTTKSGTVKLEAGVHEMAVAMFELTGGEVIRVEYEGPGLNRQSLDGAMRLTRQRPKPSENDSDGGLFMLDPELAAQGRKLFTSLGCAACHQLRRDGKPLEAEFLLEPASLAGLDVRHGCLSAAPVKGLPHYALGPAQRDALAAAVKNLAQAPQQPPSSAQVVADTLVAFNCTACHRRGELGGVEENRNAVFQSAEPEMGDEGRIPPHLDGVGAKLTDAYLKNLLANGANDRPYMFTRMPRFGPRNIGHLASVLTEFDTLEPVEPPRFNEPARRISAAGRHLTGNKALGCIKCHTFKGIRSTGVQGIDMTVLTQRLRHDWFHAYLLNPQAYRKGTRMPTAWPGGKAVLKTVLDGDANKQIEAIWLYLAQGSAAAVPFGLGSKPIELVADGEAVMFRNFIEGAGPRAIGVGYPEKANLAFDANEMRLALVWQGAFIDASKHWVGRGPGFQAPLGDNVLRLPPGPAFAELEVADTPWPAKAARELGYRFRGYRFTKDRRPTFLYDFGRVRIEDFPDAVAGKYPGLRRTLSLRCDKAAGPLLFRAARAAKIEDAGDGWFVIDGDWRMRVTAAQAPRLRDNGGAMELLVPVVFDGDRARIVQEFSW